MSDIKGNDKYITFKRADYDAVMIRNANNMPVELKHVLLQSEVKDAVVIRRQDMFAGPALHAYAASIDVAVRIAMDMARAVPRLDEDTNRKIGDLRRIADYFHEQATICDDTNGKLPD